MWCSQLNLRWYDQGLFGLAQDMTKALELWLKAGELGCAEAYLNLGMSYDQGTGVEVDKKKAKHYYELAAIGGSIHARDSLGPLEGRAGNKQQAMKHYKSQQGQGIRNRSNRVHVVWRYHKR